MAFQLGLILAATLIIGLGAWQARRSQIVPAQYPLFLRAWAILLTAFVGYVLLTFLSITNVFATDPAAAEALDLDAEAQVRALLGLVIAVCLATGLWLLVVNPQARARVSRVFPPAGTPLWDDDKRPWTLQLRGFDPTSPVHVYALGIALLFFGQTLIQFVLAGGQSGLATEDLNQDELLLSSALTAVMLLTVTGLGTGLGQDRSWTVGLHRLGLRWPTLSEAAIGFGIAVLLVGFSYVAGLTWFLVAGDAYWEQNQLSQDIAGSVTSFGAAFLVALFSSVGEEVSFRGGLQPVIGLWPTTLLFALTHIQYQFSPAVLIILVVGYAFGWARHHFGTTSAILAHFFYNFTLLALSVMVGRLAGT